MGEQKVKKEHEKENKYFALNFVKDSQDLVFFEKKRIASYKVSDKELAEKIYYWDPSIRRFIRTGQ